MNKLCIALSLMMVICISYADIYKWVDSQGNVHFSDTPHPGAEKLNIPDAQTYSPPVPQSTEPEKLTPANPDAYKPTYTKVAITQPDNEATIRNNQGSIAVTAEIEPDLFPGDKVQLIFDGSPLGEPQTNLLFQLSGIYRGSHTIAVQVIDADGGAVETSEPITVFMFRPRVGMGANGK
ncbi:DUF4124 domain-containing protein [Legionella drancourtii]|uniref:DUF4124 domain-containing protein n=1 Tax=Legionella drancourtii LLAP12 TaxID=658187 RepID=G9EKI8_9GAMM|nr:DUF4124 domain-containing protein [Legionella drancourtii]EHL32339.1 hypothetical protein LDG_5723 [Legionella drancourtii LLAP12]